MDDEAVAEESDAEVAEQPRPVIVQTFPSQASCLVQIDEERAKDNAIVGRIALMLSAALPGASVTRSGSGLGQLAIGVGKYHQTDLGHLSPPFLMELMGRLPEQPVLSLERHPHKPYIWQLVLGFRVCSDHLYALRNLQHVLAATQGSDASYDGFLVELFVPALGLKDGDGAELLGSIRSLLDFKL